MYSDCRLKFPLLVSKVVFALLALTLASCETTRMNPAEGPSASESTAALAQGRSGGMSTAASPIASGTPCRRGCGPTPTPAPTVTPTPTPIPTATPTITPIATSPTPTPTPSPSATPMSTATPTPSGTPCRRACGPTPTPTPIPTATPSATPTITPIATPALPPIPTATPASSPSQHVWIAMRIDGLPGSGTQADPYDGSTPQKFDALMRSYYWTYNLGVHLTGLGPFRTYANHKWAARPGWVISGDGMYATTLQMAGSIAGMHYGLACISSDPNIATDNVTIRDLTIDCNWTELSATADTGTNGEKNVKTGAVILWGSNNLIDHVRSINTYGSWANL